MAEEVGSIYYEVDAKTQGLISAEAQVAKSANNMSKSFDKTDKSVARVNKTSKEAEARAKALSHRMRQTSQQLSQVAQQGSVTGNYLQALLIQLPDLALGFGAVGTIVGALAGSIGIGLLGALTGAGEEIETLDEVTERLGKTFSSVAGESNEFAAKIQQLAKISKEALRLRLIFEQEDALKAATEARNEIVELTSDAARSLTALEKLGGVTAFDKLAEGLKITSEEAERLSRAIPSIADKAKPEAYSEVSAVVADLSEKYGKGNEELNKYSRALSKASQTAIGAASSLKRLNEVSTDLDEAITSSNASGKSGGDPEGDRLAKIFQAREQAGQKRVDQLKLQALTETELSQEKLTRDLEFIDAAQLQIAEKEEAEANARQLHADRLGAIDAKRTASEDREAKARIALKQAELSAYSQLGSQLTNLVTVAGAEQSAIGKAIFLANQALSVANIIVSTQAAAANALVLDPTGSLSARVTTLGYASAGIAAGVGVAQTFTGRQTGGPVSGGTPYRVNETGPELFTSGGRQYLIPDQNGNVSNGGSSQSSGTPNVTVNVNNLPAGYSAESTSSTNDNGLTVDLFITDMVEGGEMSKSIQNSFVNMNRRTI